jgi:S-formylglutathione hydrolase
MRCAVYEPPQARAGKVPVLYYLAGLTCNEETFAIKAGAQRFAAQHGLMLVAPDTSRAQPRLPGDDASWDFRHRGRLLRRRDRGTLVRALPHVQLRHAGTAALIGAHLPPIPRGSRSWVTRWAGTARSSARCAIRRSTLRVGLRADLRALAGALGRKGFQQLPRRRSAASGPSTTRAPWCDAVHSREILIDQGTADKFLDEQLRPPLFVEACAQVAADPCAAHAAGYDHSYYFIQTFMPDHVACTRRRWARAAEDAVSRERRRRLGQAWRRPSRSRRRQFTE